MPEFHAGTQIEIPDAVPQSGFRCAIPNPKRYMKHNDIDMDQVVAASHEGDYDLLEEMLSTGNESNLFNGDLNQHQLNLTPLHYAAMAGQTECVELLLKAKADPHVRENMAYGSDPEDGRTALDLAKEHGYDDIVDVLEKAEKTTPYGFYVPEGPTNNQKTYGGWEWEAKPAKGWASARPGVAERMGFDPAKYGRTLPSAEDVEEDLVSGIPKQPPLPIGLLFPGQGSQSVGMLAGVKDIPAVSSMLSKANDILGFDVLELCLKGPEDKLEETQYCQPVMFIAGMAGLEKLRSQREEAVTRFQVCAGLSLGEYTALCAAGVFSFEDGLKLVKLRGAAMSEAANIGSQSMVSVAGLEKTKIQELCAEAAKSEGSQAVCQIANELFPKGVSCAGTTPAITKLKEIAESAGALQAKVLKTKGAFHTSLMEPARQKLGKALDDALPRMKPPETTVYMNCTSMPLRPGTNPSVIVNLLKKQLTSPVLWEASVRNMIKEGVYEFYEVGPNKQLKAMMKRIDSKVWGSTSNVDV